MPITTQSFRPDDRARLQECEAALQRLLIQKRLMEHSFEKMRPHLKECEHWMRAHEAAMQAMEEVLGNTLGDEPSS